MSKLYDEQGNEINQVAVSNPQQKGLFKGVIPASLVASAIIASNTASAAVLDFSELTSELDGVKVAVVGVIAVALTIGIAIVGWRWAKRALFSV